MIADDGGPVAVRLFLSVRRDLRKRPCCRSTVRTRPEGGVAFEIRLPELKAAAHVTAGAVSADRSSAYTAIRRNSLFN